MKDDWIKIYEVDNYKINTSVWLENLLKNNDIPFMVL